MQLTTEQCKRIVFVCLHSLSPNSKISSMLCAYVTSYSAHMAGGGGWGGGGRGRERRGSESGCCTLLGCCFQVPTCEKHPYTPRIAYVLSSRSCCSRNLLRVLSFLAFSILWLLLDSSLLLTIPN